MGFSSGGGHITRTDVEGPLQALSNTLNDAGVAAADLGYVNAHGTGTQTNDAVETRALKQAFGRHAYDLKVSSTKATHGHTLAAGGAIEAVASIVALRTQLAPPTANFGSSDPECDLNYVVGKAESWTGKHALSNSFGFGGLNCCLLFSRV